jgi:cellulose synthase/poly-beta-1,6-N-acetylglucosamine synthase-like glycosyltransferase
VREKPAVSVVVPTLNEQAAMAAAVQSVSAEAEVIVVDGGSVDATVDAALAAGVPVVTTVGGAFRFAVDSPRPVYRWIEAGVGLRCRLTLCNWWLLGLYAAGANPNRLERVYDGRRTR